MKNKFPQESRLKTTAQFKNVFSKTHRKIVAEMFSIYFCDNSLSYPRMGVIVPKKNVKKANERNYYKRVVREVFRTNQNELKKIDTVFLVNGQAKKPSGKKPTQILQEQLEKLKE